MECTVFRPNEAEGFCEDRSGKYGWSDLGRVRLPKEGVEGESESEPDDGATEAGRDDYPGDGGPLLEEE